MKRLEDFKGDKRSKEYKELKKQLKSVRDAENDSEKGLGDVVEAITKATGLKAVVDKVSEVLDIDCGCDERKKKWNSITLTSIKNIFRTGKVNEINDEDYAELCSLFENGLPSVVTRDKQRVLYGIYERAFNIRKSPTSCAPCIRGTVNELYKLYKLNSK